MFSKLRCHFCGKRSPYSKGIPEFVCASCDAMNFFDPEGNVVDVPYTITNAPTQPSTKTVSVKPSQRAASQPLAEEGDGTVCQRCLKNQRMYMESLNNYLPDDLDEDDPVFKEYMKKLPQRKAELEKKYPQVCKSCAAKVQEKIHRADYYGMTQQASKRLRETKARRGQSPIGMRDDWWKWSMRLFLTLCGILVSASMWYQVAGHAYGAYTLTLIEESTLKLLPALPIHSLQQCWSWAPTHPEWLKYYGFLRCDIPCYLFLGSLIETLLLVRLCLFWYNPGLRNWYHDTYRVAAVHGQFSYYCAQAVMLLGRYGCWRVLTEPSTLSDLSKQKLMAAHFLTVALMVLMQRLSERFITFDKWTIKGKIMPKPDEKDVFGELAGPSEEVYARGASSIRPVELFARDLRSFPIENLAPKPRNPHGSSKLGLSTMPPPSPPDSQFDSDDGDAMDIDWRASSTVGKSRQRRSIYNHSTTQPLGWGALRSELSGIQNQATAEEARKRQEAEARSRLRYEPRVNPSPFRGRLEPAPMSMERRKRNPPNQVQFKETPLSERQDFMQQMRDSFEGGKVFDRKGEMKRAEASWAKANDEYDEDFSPAKTRTKGSLDLRPGQWDLPGFGTGMTGLEDAFGGSAFGIADTPVSAVRPKMAAPPKRSSWNWRLSIILLLITVAVGWCVISLSGQPWERSKLSPGLLSVNPEIEDLGFSEDPVI